jgi:hypothetical protein
VLSAFMVLFWVDIADVVINSDADKSGLSKSLSRVVGAGLRVLLPRMASEPRMSYAWSVLQR